MATKKEFIKYQAAGRSLIVTIDKKKFVFTTAEKEKRDTIKKAVESFNNLPTETKKAKLVKLLTPKTEAKLVATLVKKKKVQNQIKESKRKIKTLSQAVQASEVPLMIDGAVKGILEKDNRFKVSDGKVTLVPFNSVPMPQKLVDKIKDFLTRGQDLKPLINFWKLCLLNPNPIARTKLFDYLTLHNLIITPNGYFITYRMVKTTDDPGVYTHVHNGTPRLYYRVGEVAKLDRATQCDEDGNRDCSRGIHFGSPRFIGIVAEPGSKSKTSLEEGTTVGQGYGTKIVTTKAAHPDSYGTGYDRRDTTQKFDNSFGNQATLWLINPMHVVSIPFSDTRKMRACEGYFAKLTTPEEVIEHVIDPDYLLFDDNYKQYEEEELNKMLSETKLKAYVDNEAKAKSEKAKALAKSNLAGLREKLRAENDIAAPDLSMQDINLIIQSRIAK